MLLVTAGRTVMELGGWVMWPLLLLSVIGLAMVIERGLFWLFHLRLRGASTYARLSKAVASGDHQTVNAIAASGKGLPANFAAMLLATPTAGRTAPTDTPDSPSSAMRSPADSDDARIALAIEAIRPRLERFMPGLSTIITVSPMLGILGTVTGIIASFEAFAVQGSNAELGAVGRGIAEALWSTAAGLTVTVVLLFPFNLYRALLDRMLSRLEALGAVLMVHHRSAALGGNPASSS